MRVIDKIKRPIVIPGGIVGRFFSLGIVEDAGEYYVWIYDSAAVDQETGKRTEADHIERLTCTVDLSHSHLELTSDTDLIDDDVQFWKLFKFFNDHVVLKALLEENKRAADKMNL